MARHDCSAAAKKREDDKRHELTRWYSARLKEVFGTVRGVGGLQSSEPKPAQKDREARIQLNIFLASQGLPLIG